MRIFNITKGVRGSLVMYNRSVRHKYMITEKAKEKVKIISFWKKYGPEATKEAYNVGESTLYLWQTKLKANQGQLESLNNESTKPKNFRVSKFKDTVREYIIQERNIHHNLNKDKLSVLILNDLKIKISASTIGRIIKQLKEKGLIKRYTKLSFHAKTGRLIEHNIIKRKKLRLKNYKSTYLGDVVQIDTIVRFIQGIKRYTLTAIDTYGRFAFAYTYSSHSSLTASHFINKLIEVSPYTIRKINTDNGSEFASHFDLALKRHSIIHYHSYPRSPKMNAFVERFNRTLDEEFLRYNKQTCAYNLEEFNRKLMDYLIWYNSKRPHHSLALLSPMQLIMLSFKNLENSNM